MENIEFKHTPGVWTFYGPLHENTSEGLSLASVKRGSAPLLINVYSDSPDHACYDAHLIAAAPDLLQALYRLVRTIEISGAPVGVGYAKEAIANATTTQP